LEDKLVSGLSSLDFSPKENEGKINALSKENKIQKEKYKNIFDQLNSVLLINREKERKLNESVKKMNLSKNKLSIKNLDTNEINNYNSCYLSSNKKKDPNRTNISQNSNNTYYNNTYNNSFNNIYNAYDTIGIDKKRKEMNIDQDFYYLVTEIQLI